MEVVISGIIGSILAISAVCVYLDATKHKIGKLPGKGFFNMSAGGWGIQMLMLWIVCFPAYLNKRRDLIEKAKGNPVVVKSRAGKTALLSIGGLITILIHINVANYFI